MWRGVLLAVVLVLAGCGSRAHGVEVSSDGRAVLRDVYDGHLDQNWSCGSLRAAVDRLPPDDQVYSPIPGILIAAEARACDGDVMHLHDGSTRRSVLAEFGEPDEEGRCLLFRWAPATGALDAARVCFAGGRVSRLQTGIHA